MKANTIKKYSLSAADKIFLLHDIDEKSRSRRVKRIKFHIEQGDYFGTLAAILNLLTEETAKKSTAASNKKILKKLVQDLIFLQENFKISKK